MHVKQLAPSKTVEYFQVLYEHQNFIQINNGAVTKLKQNYFQRKTWERDNENNFKEPKINPGKCISFTLNHNINQSTISFP